jgi:alcohol dehydrogenase class IV
VTDLRTFDQTFAIGPATLEPTLRRALTGLDRVAVFISARSANGPVGRRVADALSDHTIVWMYSGILANSPIRETTRMANELRDQELSAIVSVGGGAASDTAKGVIVLLAETGRLEQYCTTFTPPRTVAVPALPHAKLPLLAVGTTLSGAEVTPGAGATDDAGIKRVFYDPKIAARECVYDFAVYRDVPLAILCETGMNGLAHCAEVLYSSEATALSDALAREGARRLVAGLVSLVRGGTSDQAYEWATSGSVLAALSTRNVSVGIHHGICHVLGSKGGLSHGVANSIVLPHVLRFNAPATAPQQELLRQSILEGLAMAGMRSQDFADQPAHALVASLQRLFGVPRTLGSVGVSRSLLPELVAAVRQDKAMHTNPVTVTEKDVLRILSDAWAEE